MSNFYLKILLVSDAFISSEKSLHSLILLPPLFRGCNTATLPMTMPFMRVLLPNKIFSNLYH